MKFHCKYVFITSFKIKINLDAWSRFYNLTKTIELNPSNFMVFISAFQMEIDLRA